MPNKFDERYARPMLRCFLAFYGLLGLIVLTQPLIRRWPRYKAWIDRRGWAGVAKARAVLSAATQIETRF